MYRSLKLLLVGGSRESISRIEQVLGQQRMVSLLPHIVGNGNLEIPQQMHPSPDALVFCVDDSWTSSFWQLVEGAPLSGRPAFMISPTNDMALLRRAMHFGIRDVFTWPINAEEVVAAIAKVVEKERSRGGEPSARLISFMDAKGGSGASFLAANLAQVIADRKRLGRRAILVDLEFQFGSLPIYLNMTAAKGLIKALEFVDSLDETALTGYIKVHDSGLRLLAAAMDELILPEDVGAERVTKLLSVLDQAYDDVIVDLPRRIDAAVSAVVQRSDTIVVVTQQTIAHLHDTRRLLFMLCDLLGISRDNILLLVNRYDKKAQIQLEDFGNALPNVSVQTVPNDFSRAVNSLNLGISVCDLAPRSALGKRLLELAETLDRPVPHVPRKSVGLFGRFWRHETH